MWAGIAITIIWLGPFVTYGFHTGWSTIFLTDKPNELGDFLAGTFAPVAFLWLVLGFFQQGAELRLQVREILEERVLNLSGDPVIVWLR